MSDGSTAGAPWWRLCVPWVPAAVAVLAYALFVDQSFVSEDFAILAYLMADDGPGRVLAMFGDSWLGIDLVLFYRPLSTAMLWIESVVFGTWSPGYKIVHVLLHAGNAVLVGWAARLLIEQAGASEKRLGAMERPAESWSAVLVGTVVASLWAIYPLHPNAVLFIGSFASLFGAGFQLIALVCWLRWRRGNTAGDGSRTVVPAVGIGRSGILACSGSGAALVAALLSYEAAFALPILLVVMECLLPSSPRSLRSRWGLLVGTTVLGATVFGVRASAVGGGLGGYSSFRERLEALEAMLRNGLANGWTLFVPRFEAGAAGPGEGWIAAAWVVSLVLLLWLARRTGDGRFARLFLIATAGVALTQLPFAFTRVVPGNGRYWYLTAWFALLAVTALVGALGRGASWRVGPVVVVGLALGWGPLLLGTQRHQQQAADLAREIQREAVVLGGRSALPALVLDVPDFLHTSSGVPAAQVYHWGFSNAVASPFVEQSVEIHRWPTGAGELPLGLRSAPDLRIVRWSSELSGFESVDVGAIPQTATEDGAPMIVWRVDPSRPSVASVVGFRAEGVTSITLYALAGGRVHRETVDADSEIGLDLPFLESMSTLVDGNALVWLEGKDERGRRIASELLRVAL